MTTEELLEATLDSLSHGWLSVKDLFQLGAVSCRLRLAIDDEVIQRSIRTEVGLFLGTSEEAGIIAPVLGVRKDYPENAAFRIMLTKRMLRVDHMTVDRVRGMGESVARFKQKLLQDHRPGDVNDDSDSGDSGDEEGSQVLADGWSRWGSPTFLGLRGGFLDLRFHEICGGIGLVFSLTTGKEYKHSFQRDYYYGYLDEEDQELHVVLCQDEVPIRDDRDLPFSFVPYDYYEFTRQQSDFHSAMDQCRIHSRPDFRKMRGADATQLRAYKVELKRQFEIDRLTIEKQYWAKLMHVKEGDMTLDIIEKYDCRSRLRVRAWRPMSQDETDKHKVSAMMDSSSVFAWTYSHPWEQLLRRASMIVGSRDYGFENIKLQSLTDDQRQTATDFLGPDRRQVGVALGLDKTRNVFSQSPFF
ncbi:expressed unknown protein [Seminavis robusta]|uniref:Uncharacterized protein n=1 Tax=Seminavis robusta TaxID=568900 RepID=A0A9N8HNW0_9STRA|nr:expressed unknown protein [Seminavis robusta]|eukprot:Sro1029_g233280.1 n/a (414) ;mRNA; f:18070-19311